MAKSTSPKNPKKLKQTALTEPVQEETKIEEPETKVEETVEPVIEKEEEKFVEETPIVENPEEVAVVEEKKPEPVKVEAFHPAVNDNRSIEEKITSFLDSRGSGEIKLNDFLKSLFGVPKFGEPPIWSSQGNSKLLRVTLTKMVTDGLINIQNSNHVKLGTFYYPDMSTGKTEYHTLNTVPMVAIK